MNTSTTITKNQEVDLLRLVEIKMQ